MVKLAETEGWIISAAAQHLKVLFADGLVSTCVKTCLVQSSELLCSDFAVQHKLIGSVDVEHQKILAAPCDQTVTT